MFRGINAVNVDAKGRMAIPTRSRGYLQNDAEGHMVVTIDTDSIREPPKMLSGIGREYIRGVTNEHDQYLVILDIHRLFDPSELQQLGAIAG